ncbi:MAG: lipopolysaccharide biosynthesis protein [Parcubacteria group bacterium LiPW_15]|nr:MAG: lipopolysaccharide biosynthesis protein [Parcubacteria group bacterium LiPW_15]
MPAKKRILIVTDSYPPELRSASELMRDLAEGLSEDGHEVYAVTSYPRFNLADGEVKEYPEISTEGGVKVLRVKVLPHHKVNFIFRGIAQLLLPHLFYRAVRKNISGKLDFVILHSPPLPLSSVSAKIAKKYGGKYILNLHDFFPQNAVDLGILKSRPIVKFFEIMESRAYRAADKIVVPSESHKHFLAEHRNIGSSKVAVIPHWIDTAPFTAVKRTGKYRKLYGLENKFIFLFAGVLGPSQGLDFVLKIAERVREEKDIHFLFVGDGMMKLALMKYAAEHNLENVSFEPFVSKEEYPLLVKDADVGIISLTDKNRTPAVPAKLMGYMAGSIAAIGFLHAESDASLIIAESKCGLTAPFGDLDKGVEAVKNLYLGRAEIGKLGENAFNHTLKYFSKSVCLKEWEDVLSFADTE